MRDSMPTPVQTYAAWREATGGAHAPWRIVLQQVYGMPWPALNLALNLAPLP